MELIIEWQNISESLENQGNPDMRNAVARDSIDVAMSVVQMNGTARINGLPPDMLAQVANPMRTGQDVHDFLAAINNFQRSLGRPTI